MRTNLRDAIANVATITGKPRIVERNTFRFTTTDGVDHIRLHNTDVVDLLPRGKVRLSSGGFRTMTTKDRINSYSPFKVYSGRGIWLVQPDAAAAAKGASPVPFYDGIILPDAFFDVKAKAKAEKEAKRQTELKAKIKAFAEKHIQKGKPLPLPNGGDCWLCIMELQTLQEGPTRDGYRYGRNPETSNLGSDHILSHLKEGYFHGSLLRNAFAYSHLSDVAYGMYQRDSENGWLDVRRTRDILRRYMAARLGLVCKGG